MKSLLTALSGGLLVLAGCAHQPKMPLEERIAAYQAFIEEEKIEQVDKILSLNHKGWTALGDQHLILYRSFNKPYLITLTRPCFSLDNAIAIKVNHHGNNLYARHDSITVIDHIEVPCFIDTIHKLTTEQKKKLFKLDDPQQPKTT